MANLGDIITSKVRIKILELFFSNPKELYHVRGMVRELNEEINAIRRELSKLEKDGVLRKEPRGNRVYYSVRPEHPFYGDFISMVAKTTGLGKALIDNKNKLGRVSIIMFSGKFLLGKERKSSDEVDILVVGDVTLPELASIIRMHETKIEREINYTVMSREELDFRRKRRDPFLSSVLAGSRVMILGNEEDLVG